MIGTVVTWNDRGGFAFLECEDGGPDVFVHVREVVEADGTKGQLRRLSVGDRVEFVTSEGPKGPCATQARLLPARPHPQTPAAPRGRRDEVAVEREQGEVVSWHDRGFAFVRPDRGGDEIFVHVRDIEEHPRRGRIQQLWRGERLEFEVEEGKNGKLCGMRVKLLE